MTDIFGKIALAATVVSIFILLVYMDYDDNAKVRNRCYIAFAIDLVIFIVCAILHYIL